MGTGWRRGVFSGRGWWEQDGEEVCSVGASKEVCPVGGAGGNRMAKRCVQLVPVKRCVQWEGLVGTGWRRSVFSRCQ